MDKAAQFATEIYSDKDIDERRFVVVKKEVKEPVTGLCMNCSNFKGCTFPMRGRAFFCEEYE